MNKRFIPIASDFLKLHEQHKLIDCYRSIIEKHGLVQSSKPMQNSENYFFILTGGTENKFIELVKDVKNSDKIKIIAIGINNSLPAALEILAYVNQEGKEGKIYYLKNINDYNGLSD
ncbi:hypothetical protein KKF86_02855 [bacterium]|nr:hypothetical protein [bacterium]